MDKICAIYFKEITWKAISIHLPISMYIALQYYQTFPNRHALHKELLIYIDILLIYRSEKWKLGSHVKHIKEPGHVEDALHVLGCTYDLYTSCHMM